MKTNPVRTQSERTAAMRAQLIEATLETLYERGYAASTVAGIAKAAGVSRGAVNHHFSSKDELVVAAIGELLTKASADIRSYAKSVRDGTMTLPDFLDRLWGLFSGRFYMVALDQITASRHNPALREGMIAVTRDFHRALDETWGGFFTTKELQKPELEVILNATMCLVRGMGVQTILRDDPAYFEQLLGFWKRVLVSETSISGSEKPAE